MKKSVLDEDRFWYKDAIIYELHVKAYRDSANDGIGDFPGLMSKLDYLQELGITAIWMLPFYPSPLKDDGYDIADYKDVHQLYGSLKDFRNFLNAAHSRGIRVITELVLNHTSDQHPWFQRSRISPSGSVYRNYYVWSNDPNRYKEARIIFPDFENSNWTWDPVAKAYYWHRFYSHQPDLNFDSEHVQKEMMRILDFWLSLGVDGMRLDAIPYLFERDGTSCEGLPQTHSFLKKLRSHIGEKFKNRVLIAEANQWPELAIRYFGNQDECHMAFHFPLMPRLFMAVQMEDRFPIVDILEQTPELPESCQWALFLRNHDELTLETVTDEERDYMYRIYAADARSRINLGIRRRLAPLMGNDRRKIELMNVLLFSLPGTPIVYYGDEIGMGDNYYLGDRDGVRTPMQWSADKNAGFSRTNPQRLYLPVIIDPEYHYQTINVDNQNSNPSSLLWWLRRLIMMRRKYPVFGRGSFRLIDTNNPKVLAFVREYEKQSLLIIINLSRLRQCVELDLRMFEGFIPEELFSGNQFPKISQKPYLFTLSPYDHYWIKLWPDLEHSMQKRKEAPAVSVKTAGSLLSSNLHEFEKALSEYLALTYTKIGDHLDSVNGDPKWMIVVLDLKPIETDKFRILSLRFKSQETGNESASTVLRVQNAKEDESLIEDTGSTTFLAKILDFCANRKKLQTVKAEFSGKMFKGFSIDNFTKLESEGDSQRTAHTIHAFIRGKLYLKVYTLFQIGIHPETEILAFLTHRNTSYVPKYLGSWEYILKDGGVATIASIQSYVEHEKTAWEFTLDGLHRFMDRLLATKRAAPEIMPEWILNFDFDRSLLSASVSELVWGFFMEMLSIMAERIANLHEALCSDAGNSEFSPEPFTLHYQRAIYQGLRSHARSVFDVWKAFIKRQDQNQENLTKLVELERKVLETYLRITSAPMEAGKIRIHGKLKLHDLLFTGKDFVIVGFQGNPERPLGERRLKRSPLRDVAAFISSLDKAAYAIFNEQIRQNPQSALLFNQWLTVWSGISCSYFLSSYARSSKVRSLLPVDQRQADLLLRSFMIENLLDELSREIQAGSPDFTFYKTRLESISRI